MKAQLLKKKLILECAVFAACIALLSALTYFVDTMHGEHEVKRGTLQSQVASVTNEMNGLREKYIRIQKDKDLYQKVMEMSNNDTLTTNTGLADIKMRQYNKEFNFTKLAFKSAPGKILEDAKYKRPTSIIVPRDASITFEGVSDEDVYTLMQVIESDFPGAVKINGFSVARISALTDESLRTITKNGSYSLVSGQILFTWLGIQPADPEAAKKPGSGRKRPSP